VEVELLRRHPPTAAGDLEDGRHLPAEDGVIFKGSKGSIIAAVQPQPRIVPEARMKEAKLPAKSIPRVQLSHEEAWAAACKAGQPRGRLLYSGPLSEWCLLGNIAKRPTRGFTGTPRT